MMPTYLLDAGLWINLWPIPVVAILLALATAGFLHWLGVPFGHSVAPLIAISLLGFVVGDMTGQSREPAVAEALSAILALLGGVLVYLIGAHGAEKQKVSSGATALLVVGLLIGANWGANLRQAFDDYRASAAYRLQKEAEEASYRVMLGLPPAAPAHPADPPKP
jgi:hypothetical protein